MKASSRRSTTEVLSLALRLPFRTLVLRGGPQLTGLDPSDWIPARFDALSVTAASLLSSILGQLCVPLDELRLSKGLACGTPVLACGTPVSLDRTHTHHRRRIRKRSLVAGGDRLQVVDKALICPLSLSLLSHSRVSRCTHP